MAYYFSDEAMGEIVRRYRNGESADVLAKEWGVTYQVIQRRLRKLGIPLRGRGPSAAGRLKISESRAAKIDEKLLRTLHSQGMSTREIAETLGSVSEEAVRRRMKALELPRLAPKARPDRNHFWNGGLAVDSDGYILQHAPGHPHATTGGYVRQHRLVMEKSLGRILEPSEVVDHMNGDPSDNRPENLRVFASNGEHLRATRTGKAKLSPEERAAVTEAAVLRAHQRVAAIRKASRTGGGR